MIIPFSRLFNFLWREDIQVHSSFIIIHECNRERKLAILQLHFKIKVNAREDFQVVADAVIQANMHCVFSLDYIIQFGE